MMNEPTKWKYAYPDNSVVFRIYPSGEMESCLVTREDVQSWIAEGNMPYAVDIIN